MSVRGEDLRILAQNEREFELLENDDIAACDERAAIAVEVPPYVLWKRLEAVTNAT